MISRIKQLITGKKPTNTPDINLENDEEFQKWKQNHPDGSFSDFYVERVSKRLKKKKDPHPTLTLGKDHTDQWASGQGMFKFLVSNGLENSHRVLDYGCGSLRLGRHLIPFLETGNYSALDVTDQFYLGGLKLIDPKIIEEKQPKLGVIDQELHKQIESDPPDYIICLGVLIHIPPSELSDFLSKLKKLIGQNTQLFLGTQIDANRESTRRKNTLTWLHSPTEIEPIFDELGLQHSVTKSKENAGNPVGGETARPKRIIYKLTRPS